MSAVAIVTDSTASLPPGTAVSREVTVVPLQVMVDATAYTEGEDITPREIADALAAGHRVSTSRPAREAFARAYRCAADAGATEIVSVHLSSHVSGTFETAQLAAKDSPVGVWCVDSRQVGMGTGFAALTAADLRDRGVRAAQIAEAAAARGEGAAALFYVDTLEFLRRGGRVGAAAALLGSALAVKPLLTVRDGMIVPLEKVRTASRALARLTDLAAERITVSDHPPAVSVQHLANADRAYSLAADLRARTGLEDIGVGEVGAVIAAHAGPGLLAVTVADGTPYEGR